MLRHVVALVDDFRTMRDVAKDFLEADRAEAAGRLAQVERLLAEPDAQPKWQRFYEAYLDAYRLKNRVALRNPLLNFSRLLLAKRLTYDTSHIYTTYYDGSNRYKSGSGVFTLAPVRPAGRLTPLTSALPDNAIYATRTSRSTADACCFPASSTGPRLAGSTRWGSTAKDCAKSPTARTTT